MIAGRTWSGKPILVPGFPHLRQFDKVILVGNRLTRMEDRAKDNITKWLTLCKNPVISYSCGKDSTVVAHLVFQQRPETLILRHSSSEPHLPDVHEMLEYWRQKGANVENWIFGSLFEWYHKYGLESPRVDIEYKKRVMSFQKERGFDGIARGVRADESNARRHLAQASGALRQQNGIWICDPIIDWTADDVWAYIAKYKLPYASVYDLEDYRDRNLRRLGSLWGTSFYSFGRIAWLRKHHPEFYRIFVREFPEVATLS